MKRGVTEGGREGGKKEEEGREERGGKRKGKKDRGKDDAPKYEALTPIIMYTSRDRFTSHVVIAYAGAEKE